MKYCKYCGNPMGDRDLFCKKCGKKQDNNKINRPSDQPTSNRSGVSNNNKSPKSKGLIIGIIAGVIVLLVVLGVAAFIFLGKYSSESGRSKIEVSERKTAKDKEDTSDEEACDVIFDYQIKDNKEYAVITGVSEEGDKVWEIETAHVEAAQLQMVSEGGIIDGDYYYTNEDEQYYLTNFSKDYFETYHYRIKQLEQYKTGLDFTFGDKLLTLQTCTRSREDLREIVLAVLKDTYKLDGKCTLPEYQLTK